MFRMLIGIQRKSLPYRVALVVVFAVLGYAGVITFLNVGDELRWGPPRGNTHQGYLYADDKWVALRQQLELSAKLDSAVDSLDPSSLNRKHHISQRNIPEINANRESRSKKLAWDFYESNNVRKNLAVNGVLNNDNGRYDDALKQSNDGVADSGRKKSLREQLGELNNLVNDVDLSDRNSQNVIGHHRNARNMADRRNNDFGNSVLSNRIHTGRKSAGAGVGLDWVGGGDLNKHRGIVDNSQGHADNRQQPDVLHVGADQNDWEINRGGAAQLREADLEKELLDSIGKARLQINSTDTERSKSDNNGRAVKDSRGLDGDGVGARGRVEDDRNVDSDYNNRKVGAGGDNAVREVGAQSWDNANDAGRENKNVNSAEKYDDDDGDNDGQRGEGGPKVIRDAWVDNFMYENFQEDEIGVRLPHAHPSMAYSRGSVWPQPKLYTRKDTIHRVDTAGFKFEPTKSSLCPLLSQAMKRYQRIINDKVDIFLSSRQRQRLSKPFSKENSFGTDSPLKVMTVHVDSCPSGARDSIPTDKMDESYVIRVDSHMKGIWAQEVWGALRALETFSQLLWYDSSSGHVVANTTQIEDAPRFSHRGVMLDTARHYISVAGIIRLLFAMSYNKFNVFHWHIVDDHSFPLELKTFPDLHKKGAYSPNMTYSAGDVSRIVRMAANLGIRVIPELDTPGHVRSWGLSHPHLLANCGDTNYPYGPLDPLKPSTYTFLSGLFSEVVSLFPDSYIHIGGDECDYQCWYRNLEIRKYMLAHNMTTIGEDYAGETVRKLDGAALHGVFTKKLVEEVLPSRMKKIAWEEVRPSALAGGLKKESLVLNVWKGGGGDFVFELQQTLDSGFDAIVSSCWYLNYISYGKDWPKYYMCDPEGGIPSYAYQAQNNNGDESAGGSTRGKVLGAEVCLWTEFIDESNLEPILWPRAIAAAERFWSPKSLEYSVETDSRFDAQHCRLRRRGIQSSPVSGPGSCEGHIKVKYPF